MAEIILRTSAELKEELRHQETGEAGLRKRHDTLTKKLLKKIDGTAKPAQLAAIRKEISDTEKVLKWLLSHKKETESSLRAAGSREWNAICREQAAKGLRYNYETNQFVKLEADAGPLPARDDETMQ